MSRFSPAHSSFAQISSAITRGFGPSRAEMLRGVASVRWGSNRRGSHSPLLAVGEEPPDRRELALLVRGVHRPGTGCRRAPRPRSIGHALAACRGASRAATMRDPVAQGEVRDGCCRCVRVAVTSNWRGPLRRHLMRNPLRQFAGPRRHLDPGPFHRCFPCRHRRCVGADHEEVPPRPRGGQA
jgi:hypothetical protein